MGVRQHLLDKEAEQKAEQQAVESAADLCASGGHAAGWKRLGELAEKYPQSAILQTAR
jgi:hypothetical protein